MTTYALGGLAGSRRTRHCCICSGERRAECGRHGRHLESMTSNQKCQSRRIYLIYQILPDAHGGQTGLKVFILKKTYSSPHFTHKWRSSLFFKMLSDEAVTVSFGKWFQLSQLESFVTVLPNFIPIWFEVTGP